MFHFRNQINYDIDTIFCIYIFYMLHFIFVYIICIIYFAFENLTFGSNSIWCHSYICSYICSTDLSKTADLDLMHTSGRDGHLDQSHTQYLGQSHHWTRMLLWESVWRAFKLSVSVSILYWVPRLPHLITSFTAFTFIDQTLKSINVASFSTIQTDYSIIWQL